jgi:ParB-like chromosome segregation protein Spo0J
MEDRAMANKDFNFLSILEKPGQTQDNRKKIHYKNLVPNENNFFSMTDIEALADNIEAIGLTHDPAVKPDGNGRYTIVSGERRCRAIRLLVEERGRTDMEMIRCVIIPEDENPLITKMKLITLNTSARELTSQDKLEAVSEYRELIAKLREEGIEIKGNTSEVIAQNMDMGVTQVKKYMSIGDKASEETREALKQGDITVEKAYELTQEEQVPEAEKKKRAEDAIKREQAAAANTPEALGKLISSFASFKKKAEKMGCDEIKPWIRKIERYLDSVGQDNEETTMEVQP